MKKGSYKLSKIILIISFLSIAGLNPAFAKKVKNKEAASLMSQCLLASDGRTVEGLSYGRAKCCSKSLGYCIYCPGNKGRQCIKTANLKLKDSRIAAPPSAGVMSPKETPRPLKRDRQQTAPFNQRNKSTRTQRSKALTIMECEALGGKVQYHAGCSTTLLKCSNRGYAACITKTPLTKK